MNIAQIIEQRDSGELRINFSPNWDYPLNSILGRFGLFPKEENLFKVTIDIAAEIVEAILWRDLSDSKEVMQKEAAKKFSEYLVHSMAPIDSVFYTNVNWHHDHAEAFLNSNSFTFSTFDCGVVCVGRKSAMSIWVEEEG